MTLSDYAEDAQTTHSSSSNPFGSKEKDIMSKYEPTADSDVIF